MGEKPRGLGKIETMFLGLFLASWAVGLLHAFQLVSLSGRLSIGLYGFYSAAAALGWVMGNFFLRRSQGLSKNPKSKLHIFCLFSPLGILYLLWAFSSAAQQDLAPLVPLFGFAVYHVFFFVPVILRPIGR